MHAYDPAPVPRVKPARGDGYVPTSGSPDDEPLGSTGVILTLPREVELGRERPEGQQPADLVATIHPDKVSSFTAQVREPLLEAPPQCHGVPLAYEPTWAGATPTSNRKWRDVPCLVFFLVCTAAAVCMSFYGTISYMGDMILIREGKLPSRLIPPRLLLPPHFTQPQGHPIFSLAQSSSPPVRRISPFFWPALVSVGVLSCVGFALVWLWLLKRFTRITICASVVMYLVLNALIFGYLLWAAPIVGLLVALCTSVMVYFLSSFRKRLHLTVLLLSEALKGLQANKSMHLAISPLMFILMAVFIVAWEVGGLWTVFVIDLRLRYPEPERRVAIVCSVFMVLYLLWCCMLSTSILRHAYSAVFAQWYFGRLDAGASSHWRRTWSALRWTFTRSLGSLCLGSPIVELFSCSFLLILHAAVRAAERRTSGRKCGCGCLRCFGNLLERAVRWITKFSYVYVAMHGHGFAKASREVNFLFRRTGMQMLDTVLPTMVISAGANVVYLLTLLVVAVFYLVLLPSLVWFDLEAVGVCGLLAIFAAAYFLPVIVLSCITLSLQSGIHALFVCYAEDLERNAASGTQFFPEELRQALLAHQDAQDDRQAAIKAGQDSQSLA